MKSYSDYDPEPLTGPKPDIRDAQAEQAARIRAGLGKELDDYAEKLANELSQN